MDSRQALYKLLQMALIEIRNESQHGGDLKNIAALSDLFHHVPLALSKSDADHDKIIHDLNERASQSKGLRAWLNSNNPIVK